MLGGLHDPEPNPPRSPLDEEIFQTEANFEKYGGDDIHNPPPKYPEHERPSPTATLSTAPAQDPNMVSWDGPDDPANPQNWTIRRKWVITMVCIVMTVNV
jgi:DHA1 family multidrug resistance protein-like MFS transporter